MARTHIGCFCIAHIGIFVAAASFHFTENIIEHSLLYTHVNHRFVYILKTVQNIILTIPFNHPYRISNIGIYIFSSHCYVAAVIVAPIEEYFVHLLALCGHLPIGGNLNAWQCSKNIAQGLFHPSRICLKVVTHRIALSCHTSASRSNAHSLNLLWVIIQYKFQIFVCG